MFAFLDLGVGWATPIKKGRTKIVLAQPLFYLAIANVSKRFGLVASTISATVVSVYVIAVFVGSVSVKAVSVVAL